MKIALLLLFSTTPIHCLEGRPQVPAKDPSFLANLHAEYLKEFNCLCRIDDILSSKWTQDLEKIPTNDLGDIIPSFEVDSPSKPMYTTEEQEWLVESGSSAKEIDSCVRLLVTEIVPLMNQREIDCLNSVFAEHIKEELVHEKVFVEYLRSSEREQLPFKRFFSFPQFADMMFQSRTPNAFVWKENFILGSAERYLESDQARLDRTFIIEQECEWKNARKLQETSGSEKYAEFERQVRDTVDQQIGSRLVKLWRLNSTLPSDSYAAWSMSRDQMQTRIRSEVVELKKQNKDAQSLCEYATEFAYELSDEQANILLMDEAEPDTNLRVSEVYKRTRSVEKAVGKIGDSRHPVLKAMATKYKAGTRCFSAFFHLVQNHRRFNATLGFVQGTYNYPEFYCKPNKNHWRRLRPWFCKCAGSFCVAEGFTAVLSAERYVLTQSPDGTYRVVYMEGGGDPKKIGTWNRDRM